MQYFTIVIKASSITMEQGNLAGAREYAFAPDLSILKTGAVTERNRDSVNYHAMQACLSVNIPLLSLKIRKSK